MTHIAHLPDMATAGMSVNDPDISTCLECGAAVVNRGGGSWTHTAKIRGRNHPAYPAPVNAEEATR